LRKPCSEIEKSSLRLSAFDFCHADTGAHQYVVKSFNAVPRFFANSSIAIVKSVLPPFDKGYRHGGSA